MYYLLTEHHVLPGSYYNLPEGEKVVLRAFFELILEARYKR
ncbi:MAG: hypothetical protein K0R00_3223 [Herbinix sp.]|jgi:hypothetical protein|nr:hypothetical protein [Herbinix sp.]